MASGRTTTAAAAVPIGDMAIDDDARLLEEAGAGDEQAFAAVYRRWQGPIYRFTLHMAGSESLAEDVTQEVFVSLAQEGAKFDARKGRASSFLFAIARNLLMRRLRREGIYEPIADETEREAPQDAGRADPVSADPGHAFDRQQAIHAVRRAVCALPVAYREAIVLCDLQEMSYADAASVLGCPVGTVRSRLHRGRVLLAAQLEPDGAPRAPAAAGPSAEPAWERGGGKS